MMSFEPMARFAKRSFGPGLVGLLASLALTAAAGAQEKGSAPAGDDTPAVVKDFEAGQKAKAEAPKKTKARKETVRLSFSTSPRVKARVYYGRKLLGTTPFSIDWPRNSGPVDVVVRAGGYLRVNTRAYTFRDDDVSVKLTRPGSAQNLVGYKAPVEPEPEEGAEPEEGEQPPGPPAAPAPGATAPAAPAPTVPATP